MAFQTVFIPFPESLLMQIIAKLPCRHSTHTYTHARAHALDTLCAPMYCIVYICINGLVTHPLQCGVLLGVLLLILSAFLTTWSCNMLVKAAWVVRRMSYESLGRFLLEPTLGIGS